MVMALGFTREQAVKALKATVSSTHTHTHTHTVHVCVYTDGAQGNSVERAADWVFSHAGELDAMETESAALPEEKSSSCRDGPGSES